MSTRRIKRINPFQAGKVSAIVSVVLILIIFLPFMLFFSLAGLGSNSPVSGMFLGGGLFAIILIPLVYGFFGFIIGILYAVIYNFTYKYHGGLELEYDELSDDVNRIGS
jgi:hypothetical protein